MIEFSDKASGNGLFDDLEQLGFIYDGRNISHTNTGC